MNRVILVGRITKDPELRTSPNNVSFTAFSIAVNRIAPSPNGEREADFINCVAFNKQAENLCRFIKKGGQIGVEGKLQTRRYKDRMFRPDNSQSGERSRFAFGCGSTDSRSSVYDGCP